MSELKKLTKMGSDTRKIAALLQAKAPKGHKLAYINDEEAALLKARGGKGTPHADTGIPSYELDDSFALQGDATGGPSEVAPTPETYGDGFGQSISSTLGAEDYAGGIYAGTAPVGQTIPAGPLKGDTVYSPVTYSPMDLNRISVGESPVAQFGGSIAPIPTGEAAAPKDDKVLGMSKDTLARLGLAGGLGLLGQRQAAKAADVGQKGATQMQALATPYQQAGANMQAAASRGELTPAAQQSLQAVQAQQAQAVQNRGGVGAAQAQQNVEAFRQQLLQQQYDYGLKLSGIGDNIALGAIKTGMQADQYVNQLTNQFYTNMAYVASGMSPGVRIGG